MIEIGANGWIDVNGIRGLDEFLKQFDILELNNNNCTLLNGISGELRNMGEVADLKGLL